MVAILGLDLGDLERLAGASPRRTHAFASTVWNRGPMKDRHAAPFKDVGYDTVNHNSFEETRSGISSSNGGCDTVASMATSFDDVIAAWKFVYEIYHQHGHMTPNRWGIHTVPQAVNPHSAVILGRQDGKLVNTMTVHFDREHGLSLDRFYRTELDALRQQGRRLTEVGLFADRRELSVRSIKPLLELMRLAWFYSVSHGITDGVIGVHPRHVSFYTRWLGFEPWGPEKHFKLIQAPLVLLRLDCLSAPTRDPLPHGFPTILSQPLKREHFRDRYRLEPDSLQGTIIDEFLSTTFAWSIKGTSAR